LQAFNDDADDFFSEWMTFCLPQGSCETLPAIMSLQSLICHDVAAWTSLEVTSMQEQIQLTKQLAEPLSQLQQTARHIAEISQECKLDLDPDEYVESFKPFSMDITYHWSKVLTAYQMCMIMINDVALV